MREMGPAARNTTYTGSVTVATAITHASSEPCSTPNTGSSAAAMMAYRLADAEPMAAGGTHAKACLYPKPHASAKHQSVGWQASACSAHASPCVVQTATHVLHAQSGMSRSTPAAAG